MRLGNRQIRQVTAFTIVLSMATAQSVFSFAAGPKQAKPNELTEEQRIVHVLNRLGFDPAQSSSIVLTTVTDVVGFFSFLGVATSLQAWL